MKEYYRARTVRYKSGEKKIWVSICYSPSKPQDEHFKGNHYDEHYRYFDSVNQALNFVKTANLT